MVGVESFVQALLVGVVHGGVYALVSVGLTLIFGVMGIVNFAQGHFLMLGMYCTVLVFSLFVLNPIVIAVLLLPLFFVVGALIQRTFITPILDDPEEIQLVVTFGILLLLQFGILLFVGPDPHSVNVGYGSSAFEFGPFQVNQAKTLAFAYSLVLTGLLFLLLYRTKLGRAIRATADDRRLSQYAGIDVERVYEITFGLGIAVTGSAGALIVTYLPVSPQVGLDFIIIMFVVVVLGGLGNIAGAVIGGVAVGIIEQIAVLWLPFALQPSIMFVVFVLIILFLPDGVLSVRSPG